MSADPSWPDNPFWAFSLRLYARPGVAPACLALQTRRGIDVNILLYCVWLGAERGIAIGVEDAARIAGSVADWSTSVVVPLRVIRTAMKTDALGSPKDLSDALRNDIKRAELDAERIEQQILFTQIWSDAPGATRSNDLARANVQAYLKYRGIQPDLEDDLQVGSILGAVEI